MKSVRLWRFAESRRSQRFRDHAVYATKIELQLFERVKRENEVHDRISISMEMNTGRYLISNLRQEWES